MCALAVLAQALSVIRRDEHDRTVAFVPEIQCTKQTRELTVDERDLAVVRRPAVPLCQIRRRLVRRVRIVVVDPEEPA